MVSCTPPREKNGPHALLVTLCLLAVLFAAPGCRERDERPAEAPPETPAEPAPVPYAASVDEAMRSVYRVWVTQHMGTLAKPAKNLPAVILAELKRSGKYTAARCPSTNNKCFVFVDNGNIHWLYTFGSSYRVSGQGHFVTNNHVVKERPPFKYYIVTSLDRSGFHPATVLWQDERKDLAVLSAPAVPASKPLAFADPAHIKVGMGTAVVGFPQASDSMSLGWGFGDEQGYLTPKVHKASLVGTYKNDRGVQVWEEFAGSSPGNSGGPMVNMCGQTVGTHYAGHRTYQTAGLNIAIGELLPELNRLNVPHMKAGGPCEPAPAVVTNITTIVQETDLEWLYYVIGGFAAAVAALGGYLIHLRRQVKKGQIPQINSRLIRGMLGISSQVSRDKAAVGRPGAKAQGRENEKDVGAATGRESKKAAGAAPVKGLTIVPLFAGASPLRLEAGPGVFIGRDPACALVISDAIISKKHCELSLVPDGLLELRDPGSANGTFAAGVSGRVRAVRLSPGERFYLADKKYSFQVEQ